VRNWIVPHALASDFALDAPINVGWGSKQTQFHGSLGKTAAQAPKPTTVGSSPDDDALPRISWRGDGAYFVVSSLSSGATRGRVLRMYSHTGILQSTSEPTPGLEHVLSWRPSGNWIVSTQRYGFPGGGEGRPGRHDVVMFERNGLRRLDFSFESLTRPDGDVSGNLTARKWRYRVKEASWSSDSNVLSLWIEKDSGDIGEKFVIRSLQYHRWILT
jgi:elongator complex protein 1